MKSVVFLLVAVFGLSSVAAESVMIQCQGKKVRQKGKAYIAHSQLIFSISEDKSAAGGARLSRWIGHVQIHGYTDEDTAESNISYYSQFLAKEKLTLQSVLSPKATVYKDSDYYRFKSFAEVASSYHDGGGMVGELLIGKEALFDDADDFEGHYVFQSGDHMGGTLDLVCRRD